MGLIPKSRSHYEVALLPEAASASTIIESGLGLLAVALRFQMEEDF